ncbi:amino acid permease [Paenibacillus lentus]|uniref:amino acid permease n=1 Tax=Paenibacillus lentus TaxID=1338368 RepID=UPI00364A865D
MSTRTKLKPFALLLMTFTAVFAFNTIINNSISIGLASIPSFLFATMFYFLPFALMIGEFSSANDDRESGIHSWIESSLGPKWAFLGAFSYFFVNLFYFVSVIPQALIYASYAFTGHNVFEGNNATLYISLISIAIFWGSTFISTKGVGWISKVTNISGMARLFIGLIFILLAFGAVLIFKQPVAQEFTMQNLTPKFDWIYFSTFAWILMAVGGAESIGVYIKNVEGGNRVFVRTMIWASLFIGVIYSLGCIAVGLIVPSEMLQNNYSTGLFDAFIILGQVYGFAEYAPYIVGLVMLLATLGSIVLWTAAPVKVLFSEIPKQIFGEKVSKTDENGNPVNALLLQAVIVTILLLIPGMGIGSIDTFLRILINMTAATSLLPVLFFIIAYIALRYKKDDMPRSFKLGSRNTGLAIGVMLLALFIVAFVIASIPEPALLMNYFAGKPLPDGEANPVFTLLYNVLGVVVFMGFAWICWNRYEKNTLKKD